MVNEDDDDDDYENLSIFAVMYLCLNIQLVFTSKKDFVFLSLMDGLKLLLLMMMTSTKELGVSCRNDMYCIKKREGNTMYEKGKVTLLTKSTIQRQPFCRTMTLMTFFVDANHRIRLRCRRW